MRKMFFCNASMPGRAAQPARQADEAAGFEWLDGADRPLPETRPLTDPITNQADEWEVIAPLPLGGAQ